MITYSDQQGVLGTVSKAPGRLLGSTRVLQRLADQAMARENGDPDRAYARLLRGGNAYLQVHEAGTVTAQLSNVLEFTGSPAWLHELRGPGGEWVHSPADVPGEGLDRYKVPAHERLINQHAKYPDPADYPFFHKHPVSPANIVAAYDKTSPELRDAGMHWYSDANLLAGALAHGNPEEGAILLATYSPQANWPINMFRAARAFDDGKPIPKGQGYITGDQVNKAQKALDGKHIDEVLTSPKTRSFAHLIAQGKDSPDDPYGHVVIDAHALNVAAGGSVRGATYGSDKHRQELADEDNGAKALMDARGHEFVADQYRVAAAAIRKRDGIQISPHQLQAVTWVGQVMANMAADRAEMEAQPQTGRAKGRLSNKAKDWKSWLAYAKQDQLPLIPGVSALSSSLLVQVLDLAAWEHEARDARGRWASRGVGIAGQIAGAETARPAVLPPGVPRTGHRARFRREITAAEARGNSRPVSSEEFQHLAALGNSMLDKMKRDHSPVTALDQRWSQVKDEAWFQVQKPWGGATFDAHTGRSLPQGADKYAISVKPRGISTMSIPENSSREEFDHAMEQARARFRPVLERRAGHLGVFHDDENHRIDMDPVMVVDTPDDVEKLGAYTHAIGGAYHFATGNGYWPPHVAEGAEMSQPDEHGHWAGPGQWRSHADEVQEPEPEDDPGTISGQMR